MTKSITRRTALKAAMADGAEDPILPLYREWLANRIEWYRITDETHDDDLPAVKAAQDREDEAYWKLVDMTPTSMAGIAALAHVLWSFDGPVSLRGTEGFQSEMGHPEHKILAAIWRSASGEDGNPDAWEPKEKKLGPRAG